MKSLKIFLVKLIWLGGVMWAPSNMASMANSPQSSEAEDWKIVIKPWGIGNIPLTKRGNFNSKRVLSRSQPIQDSETGDEARRILKSQSNASAPLMQQQFRQPKSYPQYQIPQIPNSHIISTTLAIRELRKSRSLPTSRPSL